VFAAGRRIDEALPGKPFIHLVNLNEMEVSANIPENYLPTIKLNDKIILTFQTYPDIKITSKISFIGNVIDPVNRTFRIKAKFVNKNNLIKPNMLAVAHFNDFSSSESIVVPTEIISKDINGWYLYSIINENNQVIAKKKYIQIGISGPEQTIVNSGLVEGDKVIIRGYNLVKDGTIVTVNN